MLDSRKKNTAELSDTHRTLPIALLRAREHLMERFRPMLLSHGVTEQQWRVLRVLRESDGMDATDLAAGACVLAPSLSRIIKALEAKSLIEVRKNPSDGRRAMIRLSAGGQAFIRELAPESAAIYKEIEAKVGIERIESLLNEIDTLIEVLKSND